MKSVVFLILSGLIFISCEKDDEKVDWYAYEGDLHLRTQNDINSIVDQKINKVSGDLVIEGGDIIDLSPLSSIESVGRSLVIENTTNLISIKPLSSIKRIGHYISISSNLSLKSLDGITHIDSLNGGLYVSDNPVLGDFSSNMKLSFVGDDIRLNVSSEKITGFNSLKEIGNDLIIQGTGLKEINAFKNIERISGDLRIIWSPELSKISGFAQLQFVKEEIQIIDNPKLIIMPFFDGLNSVRGVRIGGNTLVESIEFFQKVKDLEYLAIFDNKNLNEIKAFNSLEVEIADIRIMDNENLTNYCGLKKLFEQADTSSFLYQVSGNAHDPKKSEVLNNCVE